jgi:hypothetical protein
MATRCSNDSGIFRPHFDYSAPSPFGYFDNLFTPSSSPHQRNRPSNVVSDLQKFEPEAFYCRIFGKTKNNSASEILTANECSDLYVLMICEKFNVSWHFSDRNATVHHAHLPIFWKPLTHLIRHTISRSSQNSLIIEIHISLCGKFATSHGSTSSQDYLFKDVLVKV